ncbi:hypothetical protein GUJ93_ZPchr0005g15401 [Zizania palustris]|uniref:Uncharacterized protein n=1 Tax=Zizania palustris TaxID=103762 RepID=A0A8J5S3U4_ZIZPA|nr:hypothetical protein GUJ93_ZPchr0005g15401 [Zizania palustris]
MVTNGNENLKADLQQVESRTLDDDLGATGANTLSTQCVSRQGKHWTKLALEGDEFSRSIHSDSHDNHEPFQFIRKINWGYRRSERPPIGVGLTISVAIGAVAVAGLYNIISPLGKDYDTELTEVDQEAQTRPATSRASLEKRFSFIQSDERRFVESRPEWIGGLMDFWDNISLAYLSISAVAVFLGGICRGLDLMRKRFNLPASNFCFRNAEATDCFKWLCCCSCSLAQEVRTADYYDIAEDSLGAEHSFDSFSAVSPFPSSDLIL